MTRDEALGVLGMTEAVEPGQVEAALKARLEDLERRLAAAPTPALKEKYQARRTELEAAGQVLRSAGAAVVGLSRTQVMDLPLAEASLTRGVGGPGVAAVGLEPGTLLSDRYEVRRVLGSGGMGTVYEAMDRLKGERVALKVLLPGLMGNARAQERFLNEAKVACRLSHPNIVRVFDVGYSGQFYYLTMELVEGHTLRERLLAQRAARTPFGVAEALKVGEALCSALGYAHSILVHRDVKPENVFLTEDGQVKLMDFGIARVQTQTEMTRTGVALGTAYYMAPEQLLGLGEIDARADQYSVGVVLYEMLAGQVPTGVVEPLNKTRRDVPAGLSRAVMRTLSAKAEQRFPDMAAFGQALTGKDWSAGARVLKWLGAVAVLGALVVGGVLSYPSLKGLIPDPNTGTRSRSELLRFEGEGQGLLKLVDGQQRDLREALRGHESEARRLEGQVRMARSDDERRRIEGELRTEEAALAQADEVHRRYRDAVDAALPGLQGQINMAKEQGKTAEPTEIIPEWKAILAQLQKLKAMPTEIRDYYRDRLRYESELREFERVLKSAEITNAVPGERRQQALDAAQTAVAANDYAQAARLYDQAREAVLEEKRDFRRQRTQAFLATAGRAFDKGELAMVPMALDQARQWDDSGQAVAEFKRERALLFVKSAQRALERGEADIAEIALGRAREWDTQAPGYAEAQEQLARLKPKAVVAPDKESKPKRGGKG